MADIIDEINEELKQERMQALFAKYGKYVLVLAAAVVTIVVAIQGYNFYQDGVREKAANAYFDALGEDRIGEALASASGDFNNGYEMLSQFVTAAELVADDNTADAVTIYNQISADKGIAQVYRDFATLLAVTHANDEQMNEALQSQLGALADNAGPLRGLAIEMQADLALKAGDVEGAKAYLEQINQLQEAPNGLRQRAASLLFALEQ